MKVSTSKASRSGRSTLLVAAGTAVYFLTLVLVLYVLDRQLYNSAKLEIIRTNFYRIFSLPDELNDQAREALYGRTRAERETAREQLEGRLTKIVQGPTSLYRMELRDSSGTLLLQVDNPGKVQAYNSWDNSLFLRNFSGRTSLNISQGKTPLTGEVQRPGVLIGHYTSPVNEPAIEALTRRFRIYAVALVVLWLGVYAFLYRYLLRPVRNVTAMLELSRQGIPRLIREPLGQLETGYNDLATLALLQQIEDALAEPIRPGAEDYDRERGEAVSKVLQLAEDAFRATGLVAAELVHSGDSLAAADSYTSGRWEPLKDSELLLRVQNMSSLPWTENSQVFLEEGAYETLGSSGIFTYAAALGTNIFVVTGELLEPSVAREQRLEGLRRMCESVRRGFVTYRAYREGIFRQRSEANIVLSRNLGHDLTNIIATSKLDLMAVRRLMDAPQGSLEGPRGEVLKESVKGLLETTRFLQEIVNLYRAFSYVKRPQYERRDLRGLVEEFLAAFEPSVSAKVKILRELDAPMPAPIVEPRLLKLALFNVLTNSLDAMKRLPPENAASPTVTVSLAYHERERLYEITVKDNGPGIRDSHGRLLAPAEVQSVFEYGYSTKSEASEGLGLSWVKTIVSNFHDGRVRAANNVDGPGASFTLELRSMEHREARVAQGEAGAGAAATSQ